MRLVKWSPLYEPFLDLDKALSSMTDNSYSPAIDLYENEGNLIAEVALTGFSPEDVEVSIEDSVLHIKGQTHKKKEIDEAQYYRKEVRTGAFHRAVSLPVPVDSDKTSAQYEEGVLKITMPKKDIKKSSPIAINVKKK